MVVVSYRYVENSNGNYRLTYNIDVHSQSVYFRRSFHRLPYSRPIPLSHFALLNFFLSHKLKRTDTIFSPIFILKTNRRFIRVVLCGRIFWFLQVIRGETQ